MINFETQVCYLKQRKLKLSQGKVLVTYCDCDAKPFVTFALNVTYGKTEKTTEIITKIGIIACKNRGFLVEYSDAIMDVYSFLCFDVIFLEKSVQYRLPSQKKEVSVTSL